MKTTIIPIKNNTSEFSALHNAATILKEGGLVAFPTETVYGLGASAFDGDAVSRIYQAKGRPSDNPLIVHIAEKEEIDPLVTEIPEKAQKLMEAFWPGPLTMILNKSDLIPEEVSAGLTTVGIRMPSNPVARALIKEAGIPVAAPSANLSGKPSPTQGETVIEDLNGRVDCIITSDDSEIGLESTVINMTVDPPVILRPGMITRDDIASVIGKVKLSEGITKGTIPKTPASPGMKYTHYSPEAEVIILGGDQAERQQKLNDYISENPNEQVGLLYFGEYKDIYENLPLQTRRVADDPQTIARELFKLLREFDKLEVDTLFVEEIPITDKTLAAVDRLLHASGYKRI